jgi:hypothetical protein
MNDILNKTIVLVLNRNWQAINIRTPAEAFCQMATNVATALEIDGENHIRPVTWDEWITLPIRDGDNAVHTVRGAIRVPTVIVALNFAKVPKKRPKLCAKTVRERDGNRCQYTGKLLRPDEGSLDHVLPYWWRRRELNRPPLSGWFGNVRFHSGFCMALRTWPNVVTLKTKFSCQELSVTCISIGRRFNPGHWLHGSQRFQSCWPGFVSLRRCRSALGIITLPRQPAVTLSAVSDHE